MRTGPLSPAVMLFKSLATGIPKAVVDLFVVFAMSFPFVNFGVAWWSDVADQHRDNRP
jgi:hypothetical protein